MSTNGTKNIKKCAYRGGLDWQGRLICNAWQTSGSLSKWRDRHSLSRTPLNVAVIIILKRTQPQSRYLLLNTVSQIWCSIINSTRKLILFGKTGPSVKGHNSANTSDVFFAFSIISKKLQLLFHPEHNIRT